MSANSTTAGGNYSNKGRFRARGTGSLPVSYPISSYNGANNKLNANKTKNNSIHNNTATDLSPLIATSGYLTKKSRGLTSRWLRRWWQLLGDGTLIYFKGEQRLKVLGEIDIAHTCYDVQLGGEFCQMSFPPVIPTNCCLSVSVLKRTYYLFAPTPREAAKWAESLRSASYLLNRDRPRELSVNPAVLVAEEELEATPPPPPSVPPPPSSHKPPPPPPPLSSSIDDSTEGEDEHKQLPRGFHQSLSRGSHNLSVPDLRFDYSGMGGASGRRGSAGGRVRSVYNSFQNTQLSNGSSQSSNSPPQNISSQPYYPSPPSHPSPPYPSRSQPTQSTPTTQPHPSSTTITNNRRRSHSFLVHSTTDDKHEDIDNNSGLQREKERDTSKDSKKQHRTARRQNSKDGLVNSFTTTKSSKHKSSREQKTRSSHWHTSHSDLLSTTNPTGINNSSLLPSPGQLTRYKWKSEYDATGIDATYSKLEELQRQEETIKKRLRELQKTERASYMGRGIPVLPLSPTENLSSPSNYPFIVSETPPTRYGFHDDNNEEKEEEEEENYDLYPSGVHYRKPPKKPPRKAPKPLKRTPTPYTGNTTTIEGKPQGGDDENIAPLNTSYNNNNLTVYTTPLTTSIPHSSTPVTNTVMSTNYTVMTTDTNNTLRLVYKNDSKKKSSAIRYHEANIWVKAELNKVCVCMYSCRCRC